MNEELAVYSFDAQPLTIQRNKANYEISVYGNPTATLVRDTDFGMIRKPNGDALTKHPTLYKSGAEKVVIAYGLCTHFDVVSKIELLDEGGFFMYTVKCSLIKVVDGKEYEITTSYGSANTREGRNGRQSAYDGANSALKMAQKRALVSAALSLGCMSNTFTQDIESDGEDVKALYTTKSSDKITPQQVTYFYTICTRNGVTKKQAHDILSSYGFGSAKDITGGKFDEICEAIANIGENE